MLPLHIQSIHVNQANDIYKECGHGELEGDARDKLWLQPGTYAKTRTQYSYQVILLLTPKVNGKES